MLNSGLQSEHVISVVIAQFQGDSAAWDIAFTPFGNAKSVAVVCIRGFYGCSTIEDTSTDIISPFSTTVYSSNSFCIDDALPPFRSIGTEARSGPSRSVVGNKVFRTRRTPEKHLVFDIIRLVPQH